MIWIIKVILEILAMIIAYITNPIVVLFADEYGNLPKLLYWWQTHDNCLDVDWMVYEEGCTPTFAHYDFNSHYIYHYEQKFDDGTMVPGYVEIINPNFTTKERFQRYICRLCWLYRNCNYGFSYYVNGVVTDKEKLIIKRDINLINDEEFLGYETGHSIFMTPWCIYYCKKYCKWFRLRIYLGWKLKGKGSGSGRHMLALHISPFKPVETTQL